MKRRQAKPEPAALEGLRAAGLEDAANSQQQMESAGLVGRSSYGWEVWDRD